jgi:hypothetical protein
LEEDFLFGASPVIYRDQSRMRALELQKENTGGENQYVGSDL